MKEYNIRIEGVAPLIMAGLSSDNAVEKMLNNVDKDEKTAKAVKRPQNEIEKRIYICPDGRIYQPASHIEYSLMNAVNELEYIMETIFIMPREIIHEIQKYTIDERAVVRPHNKRIILKRPMLDKWALKFILKITNDKLSGDDIKNLLEYTGKAIGMEDLRPRMGRFILTEFTDTNSSI
jgi:hypothetical protein